MLPLTAYTCTPKRRRDRMLANGLFRASAVAVAALSAAACASTPMHAPNIAVMIEQEPAPTTQSILRSVLSAKFLADLPPSLPEYRRLVKALARYRAIADEEGWPSVPGQNEVKLDGKDERVSVLIKRLAVEDPMLAAIANPSTAEIRDAVKRFQARNGLNQDSRVGGGTLAALNVPADTRVEQIVANMERSRLMPRQFDHRYVAVNVPDQSLEFVRDGKA